MGTRPTLDTVAKAAGVSRQTVSNVISNPAIVAPKTLEKVRAVISDVDYRPNIAARRLRTQRSFVIGVRMTTDYDGISGFVLDHFLHEVTRFAQDVELRTLLYVADDAVAEIAKWERLLAEGGIDGLVLANTHAGDPRIAWLAERKVPFVAFGRPWSEDGTHPGEHAWVDVDGQDGVRQVTARLASNGYRRIAFIGWPEGSGVGDDRLAGYLSALADAGTSTGATSVEPIVRRCDGSVADATAVAAQLLADTEVDAVVTVSDSVALGVAAATAVSEPVGRPMAIFGFDDTPVARALGLSSVTQPIEVVAEHCIELLKAQIDAANSREPRPPLAVDQRQILVTPTLAERRSSAATA